MAKKAASKKGKEPATDPKEVVDPAKEAEAIKEAKEELRVKRLQWTIKMAVPLVLCTGVASHYKYIEDW
eukprot:CAMPEP_0118933720 /NCGR_PEP_ID=MMETSP1169-20130426/12285_1 /TAXON_ID=36882 /ORGANISM="Pyramimonas obovata, Strain CCMP722" /LENGTH=68 /DNA_ID=CAMNT_0006876525 /DNA_START=218 /DNA_END=421 /DNA_ORIENTATION=-